MEPFLETILWEFLQNLPVIVCFALAVWLWAQRRQVAALGCVVLGSAAGALVIHFTEVMADGGREPASVTIVNVIVLSILQVAFTAYLGTEKKWSSWKTDLVLGAIAGAGLAVAQGLAAPGISLVAVILHGVALAASGALVLIGIRRLKGRPPMATVGGAILLALAMTAVIGAIDYGYLLLT